MPLIETVIGLAGSSLLNSSELGGGLKDLTEFLRDRVGLEAALASLVEEEIQRHMPRLRHIAVAGPPQFDRPRFESLLQSRDLPVHSPGELVDHLLPLVRESLDLSASLRSEEELNSVCSSILTAALRGMWKRIGTYPALANQVLLSGTETLVAAAKASASQSAHVDEQLQSLAKQLNELATFAKAAWTQAYDKLADTAPPPEHRFDNRVHLNPFLLARAEDFNHNYENIARLFQGSPEWDSIQRPSDNVIIEGGRGTGKSMLLRRLTAQAALTSARLATSSSVTFTNANLPYFGVYVKLTRGYYDQLGTSELIPGSISGLLAQHELNVEIFDAFVDTVRWAVRKRGIEGMEGRSDVIRALSGLFSKAPPAHSYPDRRPPVLSSSRL